MLKLFFYFMTTSINITQVMPSEYIKCLLCIYLIREIISLAINSSLKYLRFHLTSSYTGIEGRWTKLQRDSDYEFLDPTDELPRHRCQGSGQRQIWTSTNQILEGSKTKFEQIPIHITLQVSRFFKEIFEFLLQYPFCLERKRKRSNNPRALFVKNDFWVLFIEEAYSETRLKVIFFTSKIFRTKRCFLVMT